MYRTVNTLPHLLTGAEKFALDNDRELYRPFFRVIERWCTGFDTGARNGRGTSARAVSAGADFTDHDGLFNDSLVGIIGAATVGGCAIGGRVGAELLLRRPLNKDSWMYELWCRDSFTTAKAIADEMYALVHPHIDVRTVVVNTVLRNAEHSIGVNGRTVCMLYRTSLPTIETATVRGYFGSDVVCMSARVQLENVYHNLYSPSKFGQWEASMEHERELWEMTVRAARGAGEGARSGESGRDGAGGGGEGARSGGGNVARVAGVACVADGAGGVAGGARGDVSDRDLAIIAALESLGETVFVGSIAMIAMGLEPARSRLQALSSAPLDDILGAIRRAVADTSARRGGAVVTASEYRVQLVSDFRLTKYTFYSTVGDHKTAIADVFNSTEYEVVPYNFGEVGGKRVAVGTPWVCLRFRLVDVWSLAIIARIRSQSGATVDDAPARKDVTALREYASGLANRDVSDLFPTDRWIGTHVSEKIAKKKLVADANGFFPPYYPAHGG